MSPDERHKGQPLTDRTRHLLAVIFDDDITAEAMQEHRPFYCFCEIDSPEQGAISP